MKFTPELFAKICDEIAYSNKGLVTICKKNNINASSFYDWVAADPELANKYARAREMQADFLADEIISISDDGSKDTLEIEGKKGEMMEVENKEWTNRSKLRVDARKWVASKLKPKKYGDKLDVDANVEGTIKITMNLNPE